MNSRPARTRSFHPWRRRPTSRPGLHPNWPPSLRSCPSLHRLESLHHRAHRAHRARLRPSRSLRRQAPHRPRTRSCFRCCRGRCCHPWGPVNHSWTNPLTTRRFGQAAKGGDSGCGNPGCSHERPSPTPGTHQRASWSGRLTQIAWAHVMAARKMPHAKRRGNSVRL
jgi:hypothetical protein